VRDELKRVSLQGSLLIQAAGESIRIGWLYNNLEAFTDVLAQR
jgi:hypothetical protein